MHKDSHESVKTDQPAKRATDAGDDAFRRAQNEISSRLSDRGVRLSGRETGDELANLLDAVERFEAAVENSGGDLMMDEPVRAGSPIEPDNVAFVLPRRRDGESVAAFIERVAFATTRAKGKRTS